MKNKPPAQVLAKSAGLINFNDYLEKKEDMVELIKNLGGAIPPGSNWLSELEVGTVFLAKDKTTADFSLMHLMVLDKTPKSVKLASPDIPTPRFVEPSRFCQKYMFHELLGVVKEDEATPETAQLNDLSDHSEKKEEVT